MLMSYVYSKRKTPVTIEIDTVIKFNDMCFLITSRCVVTASTARANVEDTERDVCSV